MPFETIPSIDLFPADKELWNNIKYTGRVFLLAQLGPDRFIIARQGRNPLAVGPLSDIGKTLVDLTSKYQPPGSSQFDREEVEVDITGLDLKI